MTGLLPLRHLAAMAAALLLAAPSAFAFRTVVIDSGHGGWDRGGIPGQRLSEKEMTLDTARRLRVILIDRKIEVRMTRSDDRFVSLDERSDISNSTSDAVFVSIHFDAYRTRQAEGITTFYYSRKSRPLAEIVQRQMRRRLRPSVNRGVQRRTLAVLHHNRWPAILVEGGYLTSPEEGRRISSEAYRQDMALAIADALTEYNDE